MNDPIVDEVHETRRKLMAECDGDMARLMQKYREMAAAHPSRVVTLEEVRRRKRETASVVRVDAS
jgi:hypothetical protein